MALKAKSTPTLSHNNNTSKNAQQLCASAALMANNLGAAAVLAYTRRGNMAAFLSRCR